MIRKLHISSRWGYQNLNLRRFGLRKYGDSSKVPENELSSGAIAERFAQILDEKIASLTVTSLLESDPRLKEMVEKFSSDEHSFKNQYQKHLGYAKSEALLRWNKHARELADTVTQKPWNGSESVPDITLRMIVDLKPPPIPLKSPNKRKLAPHERVGRARDASLDYKLGKYSAVPQDNEDDNFRELYKERLLGPSMFLNTNLPLVQVGLSGIIADAKVNESIDRKTGQFLDVGMQKVRGKPLDAGHLRNCSDSNYFMNQILNSQEVLPPWIESQQSIDGQIQAFRKQLDEDWFRTLVSHIRPNYLSKDELEEKVMEVEKHPSWYYDLNFRNSKIGYVIEKVKLLNNSIRDYNLQSPSSAIHKIKLYPTNELEKLFERSVCNLRKNIHKWLVGETKGNSNDSAGTPQSSGNFLRVFDYGDTVNTESTGLYRVRQKQPEKIEFWKSFKEMFSSQ